jgi:hypothetical protein
VTTTFRDKVDKVAELWVINQVSLAIGCLTILVEIWIKTVGWTSKDLV